MAVVQVVELVGTSNESWQDAAEEAIREASRSLRHIRGVDIVDQTAQVREGKITEYRTTLDVTFVVGHHRPLLNKSVAGSEDEAPAEPKGLRQPARQESRPPMSHKLPRSY